MRPFGPSCAQSKRHTAEQPLGNSGKYHPECAGQTTGFGLLGVLVACCLPRGSCRSRTRFNNVASLIYIASEFYFMRERPRGVELRTRITRVADDINLGVFE